MGNISCLSCDDDENWNVGPLSCVVIWSRSNFRDAYEYGHRLLLGRTPSSEASMLSKESSALTNLLSQTTTIWSLIGHPWSVVSTVPPST